MAIKIIGTGSYLPENVADNHFLSTIVDTNDEWISQRTGIKERRLSSGSKEGTTYMATQAAKNAMEDAGVTAEELRLHRQRLLGLLLLLASVLLGGGN